MQDPASGYPRPPFKRQSQSWPGLASKMEPRPDHGETSYRGSGRLSGRKALITGGDSGMGRAAAIAYAREGADVAINYYPDEEPDAQEVIRLIKDAGRNGFAIPGIFGMRPSVPNLSITLLSSLAVSISSSTMPLANRHMTRCSILRANSSIGR